MIGAATVPTRTIRSDCDDHPLPASTAERDVKVSDSASLDAINPMDNRSQSEELRCVHVVVVNYRSAELTADLLKSLSSETSRGGPGTQITVVDGASGDNSTEFLHRVIAENGWSGWCQLKELTINGGFAFANNAVLRPTLELPDPPDYLLLLNPDTIVRPNALNALAEFMQAHTKVGICGSRLEDLDGTTQLAARRFPGVLSELESTLRLGFITRLLRHWTTTEPESDLPHATDWLPGASLMIRREVLEEIGLLDESYFMYYEEVDFCLRAKRAGWQVWYVPDSRVVHLVGQSSGVTSAGPRKRLPQYWYDSRKRYFEKNHGRLKRLMADLAFILGFSTWRLRRWIQQKPDLDPPRMLSDFIWHSLTGRIRA